MAMKSGFYIDSEGASYITTISWYNPEDVSINRPLEARKVASTYDPAQISLSEEGMWISEEYEDEEECYL